MNTEQQQSLNRALAAYVESSMKLKNSACDKAVRDMQRESKEYVARVLVEQNKTYYHCDGWYAVLKQSEKKPSLDEHFAAAVFARFVTSGNFPIDVSDSNQVKICAKHFGDFYKQMIKQCSTTKPTVSFTQKRPDAVIIDEELSICRT